MHLSQHFNTSAQITLLFSKIRNILLSARVHRVYITVTSASFHLMVEVSLQTQWKNLGERLTDHTTEYMNDLQGKNGNKPSYKCERNRSKLQHQIWIQLWLYISLKYYWNVTVSLMKLRSIESSIGEGKTDKKSI